MAPVTFDNDPLTEAFADNLRMALARRRVSARALGRRMGVSHTWVSLRATGAQSPTLRDVYLIAGDLGMAPEELMGLDEGDNLRTEARDVHDILTDERIPGQVQNYFRGALGALVALAYAALPSTARGRAVVTAPQQRQARPAKKKTPTPPAPRRRPAKVGVAG